MLSNLSGKRRRGKTNNVHLSIPSPAKAPCYLKNWQVGEAFVYKNLHVQFSVLSLGNVQDLNVETDENG